MQPPAGRTVCAVADVGHGNMLPDYQQFFDTTLHHLDEVHINIRGYRLSHLGLRLTSLEQYQILRDALMPQLKCYCENVYNGRPVGKLILKQPLKLGQGFTVDHIEAMPPRPDQSYDFGFEHLGVVIGKDIDQFAHTHKAVLTGQQQHGPTPYFIKFTDGSRVKFFKQSLEDIVRAEGQTFLEV